MNKKDCILLFDSGVGGLTVLNSLIQLLPNEKYVYYADIEHAPYGHLPLKQLKTIVINKLVALNKKFHPKCIVIACNTVTTCLIQDIRRKFPTILIIGVEPAIKPALENFDKILVLATKNTLKNCYSLHLYSQCFKSRIQMLSIKDLALNIDKNVMNIDILHDFIYSKIKKYIGNIDCVVLGCTHYVYLTKLLHSILGDKIAIIDGNLGVCKQVLKKLQFLDMLNNVSLNIEFYHEKKQYLLYLKKAFNVIKEGI